MADKQPVKRQVKNPETFRERAIKAAETDDKPSKASQFKAAGSKATSPVRQTAQRVGSVKALKPLRKPFRLIGKVLVPSYFRQSVQELKLVTWPSWEESRRLTTAVLIFAIIFGAVIAVVDFGLDKLFRDILLK